jgi:hypothetical protein
MERERGRDSNALFPPIGEPMEYGSDEKLYTEIHDLIYDHIDISDNRWYDVLTSFVFATWLCDRFDTATYIAFVGDVASGKTDALSVLSLLSFKGCLIDRPTRGSLSRLLSRFRPTLLLDNVDKINRGDQIDIASIIESGYKRGVKIPRTVNWQGPNYSVIGLNIFGFKGFAANREFVDNTMSSRCLTIYMSKNVRKVKRPFDFRKFDEVRCKLRKWAPDHKDDPLPESSDDSFKDGRLNEIIYPLLSVAPTELARKAIIEIGKVEDADRQSDIGTDLKRDTARVVIQLAEKGSTNPFAAQQVVNGLVDIGYPQSMLSETKMGFLLREFGCDHFREGSGRPRRWLYMLRKRGRDRLILRFGFRPEEFS